MKLDTSRRPRRGASSSQTRTDRRGALVRQRRFVVIPIVAVLAVLLVAGGVALALTQIGRPAHLAGSAASDDTPLPDKTLAAADGSVTPGADVSATSTMEIEVPDVVGKPVGTAEAILQAAGFTTLTRVTDKTAAGVSPDAVVSQWPNAGARLQAGERVVVTYQPAAATPGTGANQLVVVIDPGHQATLNRGMEPIGPGSKQMKMMVSGGASGVNPPHVPEYVDALAISLRLRGILESKGVKVVMTRTTNNVDISNKQRALIGNTAKADLVVRVHLDSSTSSAVHGISTLYPSGNSWVAPIEAASKRAAGLVQDAVTAATGAASKGLSARGDMTGFNWSTRPVIIVECGFMSNPAEDTLCDTSAYQDKIAAGIADGVMSYLGAK